MVVKDNKNRYFNYLITIYNDEMQNEKLKGIRNLGIEEIDYINNILESFFSNISEYSTLNLLLESLLTLTGRLWLIQPFVDGNTRTLNRFIQVVLSKLDYHIELDENVIPLFYDLADQCSMNDIIKVKAKIKTVVKY